MGSNGFGMASYSLAVVDASGVRMDCVSCVDMLCNDLDYIEMSEIVRWFSELKAIHDFKSIVLFWLAWRRSYRSLARNVVKDTICFLATTDILFADI